MRNQKFSVKPITNPLSIASFITQPPIPKMTMHKQKLKNKIDTVMGFSFPGCIFGRKKVLGMRMSSVQVLELNVVKHFNGGW